MKTTHRLNALGTTLFLFLCQLVFAATTIEYQLSMPEPHTHYYEVEMKVNGLQQEHMDFKMAVWAPGSYLVREYSKSVEEVIAKDGKGNTLKVQQTAKNTWRVFSNKADGVTLSYKVYAFEMSVRTSFLDASHGYLNGTSIFMYVAGQQDASGTVTVKPYKDWKKLSTALPRVDGNDWKRSFPNYDLLVDSPMEIGNHKEFSFDAAGIKHHVAMYGEGNYDVEQLKKDMANIVEACAAVFNGDHPCKEYTFIIHNLTNGSGGLEHLHSTTLQVNRWTYAPQSSYNKFLSLVAHEYFHLWNVKRIRPKALGPFDYENENYTTLLWVMEGFTSYYDELLLRRAGYYNDDQYMRVLSSTMGYVDNQPGSKVQSAAAASFNAWIKAYRPNENSINTTISYYSKGQILAAMIDLAIIKKSKGKQNLDDLMRFLYNTYYKKAKRGFTDEEMVAAVSQFAGKESKQFFKDHVYDTKQIDYNRFFNPAGLEVVNINEGSEKVKLGVRTKPEGGKTVVSNVYRGSSAYNGGINVNDEIIAIDGYRVAGNLNQHIEHHKAGDVIEVLLARDQILQTLSITLQKSTDVSYRIKSSKDANGEQQRLYRKWLSQMK